jgi:hypothetical protein
LAHPSALQPRNPQSLVEIGMDKNTTVIFAVPQMSTTTEFGSLLAGEQAAAAGVLPPSSDNNKLPTGPGGATDAAQMSTPLPTSRGPQYGPPLPAFLRGAGW